MICLNEGITHGKRQPIAIALGLVSVIWTAASLVFLIRAIPDVNYWGNRPLCRNTAIASGRVVSILRTEWYICARNPNSRSIESEVTIWYAFHYLFTTSNGTKQSGVSYAPFKFYGAAYLVNNEPVDTFPPEVEHYEHPFYMPKIFKGSSVRIEYDPNNPKRSRIIHMLRRPLPLVYLLWPTGYFLFGLLCTYSFGGVTAGSILLNALRSKLDRLSYGVSRHNRRATENLAMVTIQFSSPVNDRLRRCYGFLVKQRNGKHQVKTYLVTTYLACAGSSGGLVLVRGSNPVPLGPVVLEHPRQGVLLCAVEHPATTGLSVCSQPCFEEGEQLTLLKGDCSRSQHVLRDISCWDGIAESLLVLDGKVTEHEIGCPLLSGKDKVLGVVIYADPRMGQCVAVPVDSFIRLKYHSSVVFDLWADAQTVPWDESFDAQVLMVRILMALHRYDDAIAYLHKATQSQPLAAILWLLLGHCCFSMQRFTEAVSAYQQAMADESSCKAVAYYYLGLTYIELQQTADALHAFSQACRVEPANIDPLLAKADTLFQLQRFPEAVELYQYVLRKEQEWAPARYHLGLCYIALRELEKAQTEYNQLRTCDESLAYDLAEKIHTAEWKEKSIQDNAV